tara:strand:+ start:432 stop:800 length:369 start_codon:yes stop_codon:yes gene_type:complete
MTNTQFKLDINASNGTGNLSYLLSDKSRALIDTLSPAMIEEVFGPGDDRCFDQSKGYTDPEWYWQTSNGSVWGIGWRWGTARLRGRGRKQGNQDGPFFVHPLKEEAAEFVEFLAGRINASAA